MSARRVAVLVVLVAAMSSRVAAEAGFVSSERCRSCHQVEFDRWSGSHHAKAMQEATPTSVLGNFNDAVFSLAGRTTRFFRRGDKYWVRTLGPRGQDAEFAVRYTFGIEPLQQYLIEVSGGRLQALKIAWDTRSATAGGQRWFHLAPEEAALAVGDPFHWTGALYNWNSQCGFCHSTAFEKSYDAKRDVYASKWAEINVACEACHGPGSAHVAWAGSENKTGDNGLLPLSKARAELNVCAPCHSRRTQLGEPHPVGDPLMDGFDPSTLRPGLYFEDGQILEEVYVWGSFVQSRMHRKGVRCGDCHEPHGLRLRAEGNALCVTCHNPGGNKRFASLAKLNYDSAQHHHHQSGSDGARCVSCHMPERTYMVVDDRRDHGFRIPRPDLSQMIGTPNACNQCHTDKTPEWAASAIREWTGRGPTAHWSEVIAASRRGNPSPAGLAEMVSDRTLAAIVRASALDELANAGRVSAAVVTKAGNDSEPFVRAAAARALDSLAPPERTTAGVLLLRDPIRAVRIEAARSMADLVPSMKAEDAGVFAPAGEEYRRAQRFNSNRPEGHYNLGSFESRLGNLGKARVSYEKAIEVGAYFVPAYVNLADVHRVEGREVECEKTLRNALVVDSENAAVRHSLGLSLIRQSRTKEALAELAAASTAAPEVARYAYVYGVALNSSGRGDEALAVLSKAERAHPRDIDVLTALFSFHRERGDMAKAKTYLERVNQLRQETRKPSPLPPGEG